MSHPAINLAAVVAPPCSRLSEVAVAFDARLSQRSILVGQRLAWPRVRDEIDLGLQDLGLEVDVAIRHAGVLTGLRSLKRGAVAFDTDGFCIKGRKNERSDERSEDRYDEPSDHPGVSA